MAGMILTVWINRRALGGAASCWSFLMLPPRDYPEDSTASGSANPVPGETDRVTVRAILDRSASEKPVTDAMIQDAVTNLFVVEAKQSNKTQTDQNSTPPAEAQASQSTVSETLRTMLRNVIPD